MSSQRRVVTPGPEDESLLHLQSRHISQAVWTGAHEDRVLKPRRVSHRNRLLEPPLAIIDYLRQAGFYGASRLPYFDFNAALVSALVERWRPETHTFHMTVGESTITLQDVAIQLGLPCEGIPVSGQTGLAWPDLCESLLGIRPPNESMQGQRLSIPWLEANFGQLPDDADDEQIQRFTRAYILRLIGGILMPDTSGHRVMLMYLPLLENLEEAGRYSWGSAVLACLYRELCNATNPDEVNIGGCLTLLHLWAWDRFPFLAPQRPPQPNPEVDRYPDLPPLGFRWKHVGQAPRPPITHLRRYSILLDQMRADEIIWCPYDMPSIQHLIPEYCLGSGDIWLASIPIICFHVVEWHHADRVLRQFGRQQPIPQAPFDCGSLHTLALRGRTEKDWRTEHMVYIAAWNAWPTAVTMTEVTSDLIDHNSGYMRWYWKHTRRWITPVSAGLGFVADVVEALRTLTFQDPPSLDYSHFRERVDRDCGLILRALGEHRDLAASQPTPHATELPRPPRPEPRRGKRGHGFMSARDPIVVNKEDDDDYD